MLVTADPVAEIDDILCNAAVKRSHAWAVGDTATADRMTRWIDRLLDLRLSFRYR